MGPAVALGGRKAGDHSDAEVLGEAAEMAVVASVADARGTGGHDGEAKALHDRVGESVESEELRDSTTERVPGDDDLADVGVTTTEAGHVAVQSRGEEACGLVEAAMDSTDAVCEAAAGLEEVEVGQPVPTVVGALDDEVHGVPGGDIAEPRGTLGVEVGRLITDTASELLLDVFLHTARCLLEPVADASEESRLEVDDVADLTTGEEERRLVVSDADGGHDTVAL
mmetsp:Transcript_5768/g.8690  ORF Transcript_5768/g.8690 Transcript_5768/m.8690 type:complete len:226 (+) Transcript_5768:430-1107(+)